MYKLICSFIATICCLCVGSAAYTQEIPKKKVAVYVSGNEVDGTIKKVFGAKLVSAIANSNGYAAVERTTDFLQALQDEADYQTSGEVRDSQIASLGQRFGVRFVVVADVTQAFDEYFISSRLINVETGLIGCSFDVNGPAESMSQLVMLAEKIADGLILTPEREEIKKEEERKMKLEEEKRLRQERALQEMAEKERLKKAEAAQKRQIAINNLIKKLGYKCYIVGNIIVMDDLIGVSFKYDENRQCVVSTTSAPPGWRMADIEVYRAVTQYGRYSTYVPGTYWVVCPVRAYPDRRSKFNDSKRLGSWTIGCFDLNLNFRETKFIGETIKQKGSNIPLFHKDLDSYFTLFYRPMFSESEIQAEIDRIN